MELTRYTGSEIEPLVHDLARLRTRIFREYPYLYDGGETYEAEYLSMYTDSDESLCVVARDGDEVVGASTGLPLTDADEAFQRAFAVSIIEPFEVFYFGESVLSKKYRGRGIGHRFFEERENYARELGRFSYAAFCAVERSPDHPRRPPSYAPLDRFWEKHGFTRRPDLRTRFAWKEIGEDEPSEKMMVFWVKELRGP